MVTVVTSTIGTGGDYTTVQAWEDASPANLVTDDKIWKGLCKNQEFAVSGTALTVSGSTVDSTRYKELTTDTGASFRDNASVQTNALRYNSANGAAIKSTNNYATCIVVSENYFRISNLQVAATGAPGTSITASGRTGVVCDGCIVESNSAAGMTWHGSSAVLSNTLVIQRRGTGSSNYVITFGNGGTVVNCTLVGPSDLATKPANAFGGQNYGSATLKNTAVFGCTALEDSSTTFTYSGNATDLASPPSGWTGSLTYSSQFQTVTTASSDFRLKSGANLIDACTADTTLAPIDIAGTTRATGASQADIGAWEFVSAASGSAITAAAGSSAASALTGASTAATTPASASGAASAQALAGSAIARGAITAATGAATAAAMVGGTATGSTISAAAGAATASSLAGASTSAATISAAAGAASASGAGASTATAAIGAAAGASTAADMVGVAGQGSTIGVAAGASTASAMAGASIVSASFGAAAGAASAQIVVGAAFAQAAIGSAAGAASAAAMVGGVTGGTASAAEVWAYVMSNGYTAEENVVAIRSMLEALTPAVIAEEVLHNALV